MLQPCWLSVRPSALGGGHWTTRRGVAPILFWQQRLGVRGRPFVIYKLRTLRPPFDQLGNPIPDSKRLSGMGSPS